MIGRTKLDSVELEDKAADSHVASTDQDRFGKIFRRNMPYGTVTDHGTMFVGFSADQRPLADDAREHGRARRRRPRRAHPLHAARSPARTTSCRRSRPCSGSRVRSSRSGAALLTVDVALLPAVAADDAALVDGLVAVVNEVYATAEDGLWGEGWARTSSTDVAELIRAGQLAAATREGRIVGCIRVHDVADDTSELGLLAAAPSAQGSGVGRALVAFAEEQSRTRGLRAIQLELLVPRDWRHPSKELLKAWYGRMGYGRIRTRDVAEVYPQLVPLLVTPCEIETYEKPLQPGPAPARRRAPAPKGICAKPWGSVWGSPRCPDGRSLRGWSRPSHHTRREVRDDVPDAVPRLPARRAALLIFALLALALGFSAAASAADGGTGTIVVHQRSADGGTAPGGCYRVDRVDGADPGFWGYRCDGQDNAGTDGDVVVSDLPAGTYRLEEETPPPAFKASTGTFSAIVGDGDTATVTRSHDPLPPLRVVTNGEDGKALAGSCWRIHSPGEYEGYIAEACDGDDGANDGTTTFKTIRPGDYEIRHMEAPTPYHRLDDVTPFAMPDAEKTLTFALEREIAPVNTAAPTVTGQAKVGETLTGGRGTWTGTYLEFSESWQRCDAAGATCLTIDGSFGEDSYTLTADDLGKTLRFAVTARNVAGRVSAVSAPVAVMSLEAPANTARPTIAGAVESGQKLVGNPGTWTGAPTFAYQWQHCATDGTTCTDIDRATGSTYTLTTADAGFRMRLVVTARNDAGLGDCRLRRHVAPERRAAQPGAADDQGHARGRRPADRLSGLVDLALRRHAVRLSLASLQRSRHE